MAIVPNDLEGVVLTGAFDRTSPTYQQEAQQFVNALTMLQKQAGFAEFLPIVKGRGAAFKVYILPASSTAPPQDPNGSGFKEALISGRISGDATDFKAAPPAATSLSDLVAKVRSKTAELPPGPAS